MVRGCKINEGSEASAGVVCAATDHLFHSSKTNTCKFQFRIWKVSPISALHKRH